MSIKLGTDDLDALYVGTDAVSKVYLGADELWPLAPTFEPEDVAGAVACWIADDCSAVGDGNALTNWVDRKNSLTVTQGTEANRPLYRATGIGGQPAVDFDGANDMLQYVAADPVSVALSGHVFMVLRPDAVGLQQSPWGSADHSSNTQQVQTRVGTGDNLEFFQVNADTHDYIRGNGTILANNNYLAEWASTGSAYQLRLNGTGQSLTQVLGANTGDWFGDTPGRDSFCIGSIRAAVGFDNFFNGKIAMLLVVDGAISAGDRAALHAWVAAKYGITIA